VRFYTLAIVAALLFAASPPAQAIAPQGDSVGTLPADHPEDLASHDGKPEHKPDGQDSAGSPHRVKRGETHTNEDGVTVTNNEDSSGNAEIDPKKGTGNSSTEVDTKTGFEGKIAGIDSNDEVDLASSNDVEVEGTGGTVTVSGGSTVKITNTNPAPPQGGTSAGASITVTLPSGNSLTVPAGSTVTITT